MKDIAETVSAVVTELFALPERPIISVTRPEPQFGDFATNVALQLAKPLGKNPRDVAEQIVTKLRQQGRFKEVTIAGPGFINLRVSDDALLQLVNSQPTQTYVGKSVMIEHTDPNPFKPVHIGHAYSNTVGESLARLFKAGGATVKQVSYHGDVGMHVAMAIWGMQHNLETEVHMKSPAYDTAENAIFLGACYAQGATAFKDDSEAAEQIKTVNKHVYAKDDETINQLYEWGTKQSFDYFELVCDKLHTGFQDRYLESITGQHGAKIVREHTGTVFEESEGAVVYRGEQDGLHTRVFLNSQGLPTYEAKELGLAFMKEENDKPDLMVIVTANEIDEYFKVLTSVLKKINPQLGAKVSHVSHGVVKLPSGKMSSRTGKVKLATDVLYDVKTAITAAGYTTDQSIIDAAVLGALKYSFLKHRVGGDLVFDIDESISLEGNSGPYLQYAHARARSILRKAGESMAAEQKLELDESERMLAVKLGEYAEVVDKAVAELMPHHICTYLYELAQTFNRFYEKSRIIGDEREAFRLQLAQKYADTLKKGLELLNIPAPEQM